MDSLARTAQRGVCCACPLARCIGMAVCRPILAPLPAGYTRLLTCCRPFPTSSLLAGKELNARRSPKQLDTAASSPAAAGASGRSGEKFRALKAREAAKKAAAEVSPVFAAFCLGSIDVNMKLRED